MALVEAKWMLGQFGALHGKLVVGCVTSGFPWLHNVIYIRTPYTHDVHIISLKKHAFSLERLA